jgi:hypothetical protein
LRRPSTCRRAADIILWTDLLRYRGTAAGPAIGPAVPDAAGTALLR